ncbi:MAG: septum formation initiator family protein [Clostridia bacterium]|nr:septum formation initiator family protein [Clostridia bacterium]
MALTDRNAAYDLTLFEEEEAVELAKAKSQKNIVYDIEEERKKRTKAKPKVNPLAAFLSAAASSLVILAVAAIIHGQAQLTELNQQISDAQGELTELESYYTQLEMKVENKLGPSVIEEYAKNILGMAKTESYQKEFISLSDGDKAEVAKDEKKNIFERIADALSQVWSDGG